MSTAIQEAIERFNLTAICNKESLDELLYKEKQQITDAYICGCNATYGIDEKTEGYDETEAEQYFNDKYATTN